MRADNTEQPAIQNQRHQHADTKQRAARHRVQADTGVIAQIIAEHQHIAVRAATLADAPVLVRLVHLRVFLRLLRRHLRQRQPDAKRSQHRQHKQRRCQRQIAPLAPHRLRQLIQKISGNFLRTAALAAVQQLMPLHGEALQTVNERGRKAGVFRIQQLLTQRAIRRRKIQTQILIARLAFALPKKML